MNTLAKVFLIALIGLVLTSCGRRGPLEPPPGVAAEQPADPTNDPTNWKPKKQKKVPIGVPQGSFILDPIL